METETETTETTETAEESSYSSPLEEEEEEVMMGRERGNGGGRAGTFRRFGYNKRRLHGFFIV